jgi:tetratricopeptide (TPR) repeat protein
LPEDPESYPAVQLFIERARQVQSQFALSNDNVGGVLDICRLVAGLPLGIVLAAAWVRHFSTARIANSIKDNLDFLASSSRDASPQHSSLRAVFTHSWNLLSKEEQEVFRKLSVFRGGWDEEAAEKVAGASLYTLLSLVDKSLVRRGDSGRFSIHEVLRQYAAEQLDALPGERDDTRAGHGAYFLDLAEQAGVGKEGRVPLRSPDAEVWLDRLEIENKNLREALQWTKTVAQKQLSAVEVQVRLVGALWRFWYLRGYYREGQEYLMDAISATRNSAVEDIYLARANHGAGVLAGRLGDFAVANRHLQESLRLYRQVGDKGSMAYALISLGLMAHDQGDYALASEIYSEGLAVSREIGDKTGIVLTLNNLGNVAREQGDYARAQALFEECLPIAQEIGDKRRTALSLASMGIVAWCQGDYSSATPLIQQSLKLNYELNDRLGISNCLEALARVASSEGKTDRTRAEDAARLWGGAEALLEAIGSSLPPADRADHDGSVATAVETLGKEAYEAAWAEGHAIPVEQMLAQALKPV